MYVWFIWRLHSNHSATETHVYKRITFLNQILVIVSILLYVHRNFLFFKKHFWKIPSVIHVLLFGMHVQNVHNIATEKLTLGCMLSYLCGTIVNNQPYQIFFNYTLVCPTSKKRGYIVLLMLVGLSVNRSVGRPNGFRWLS